ncbi:predicted protein [Nematostella vectensis]|uniref:Uncharacterized protein n=1 Tax=Nematostella vectensis TaxID=45351 RepID=A7RVZ4_NEMVE|nr:predicted protein [Nematostella vectensis]|eukprot:XP_001636423.1 predicted protein [Nematostella vectensis]
MGGNLSQKAIKGWPDDIRDKVIEERKKYGDLEFLPTSNGYWYGHRYLWMLFWAFEHYDFDFFLKTDDDYFVCLNNLANDLQYRKNEKYLYWDWLGCDLSMVAMDSGLLILGKDLTSEFVKRNDTLILSSHGRADDCYVHNELEDDKYDVTYFADNSRLVHYRSDLKDKLNGKLRSNLIGIHQAYPKYMREYWNYVKDNWLTHLSLKVIRKPYGEYCARPKGWDWTVLNPFWKHEPKSCWAPKTDWPELHKYKMHKGREDKRRL